MTLSHNHLIARLAACTLLALSLGAGVSTDAAGAAWRGPVASPFLPEFAVSAPKVIYTRPQLARRGLRYWPDGNIGLAPLAKGKFVFLAANSERSARTVGTPDDPAAAVSSRGLDIRGIAKGFAYRAGGPLYEDPASGLLVMLYHAERHYSGTNNFYAEIGMAKSTDGGRTFTNLGIILSPHAPPSRRSTAEMGGGTFAIRDEYMYVFFRDSLGAGGDVNLAVARASLEDVMNAAGRGAAATFHKFYNGSFSEPGVAGRSSPLEVGNPLVRWMSVTWDTVLDRFVMVIAQTIGGQRTDLYLTASQDGVTWSPRKLVFSRQAELFYPSIVDPDGKQARTDGTFDLYFTSSHNWRNRWSDARVERVRITLSGRTIEMPHAWEFTTDAEGWKALNQVAGFTVRDGSLIVTPSGLDPFMVSPAIALPAGHYRKIVTRLKTDAVGVGQFFFTGSNSARFTEENSRRFPITPGGFRTYTLDMSDLPDWQGTIGQLRFDPTDHTAPVTIDFIRLAP